MCALCTAQDVHGSMMLTIECSHSQVTEQLEAASQERSKVKREQQMRQDGLYNSSYAFHPDVFPYVDPFRAVPQDVMHAEFSSGTANSELAEMLYLFISKEKWFSVAQLNAAIDSYSWPQGTKPPAIWDSVKVGRKGGLPADGAHLRYSGSQTMNFARASITLLDPLVADKAHPAWLSWIAHHDYINLLLADHFTLESVRALDKAIQKHHKMCASPPPKLPTKSKPNPNAYQCLQRRYYQVPEYKEAASFRPKNHFALQYTSDILNCGPCAHAATLILC